jgi:hypothetical protein
MMTEARKEFMRRWLAYGSQVFARAEAHGVEWRNLRMEQVEPAVILAEEFAAPDEYKRNPFPSYQ